MFAGDPTRIRQAQQTWLNLDLFSHKSNSARRLTFIDK
jgi:hypothetical protein